MIQKGYLDAFNFEVNEKICPGVDGSYVSDGVVGFGKYALGMS